MKPIEERTFKEFVLAYPSTSTILFILISLYLLTYILGNGPQDPETARQFGALYSGNKEWSEFPYLLTSTYQHIGGWYHLFSNVLIIIISAPLLEKIFGTVKFVLLFNLSGIFGSLVTLVFTTNVLSSGASSAAFGLIGIYIALIVKKHPSMSKSITQNVFTLSIINILFTFLIPGISVTGHLGGLFSGILLGIMISPSSSFRVDPFFVNAIKTIGCTFLLFVILAIPQKVVTEKGFVDIANEVGLSEFISSSSSLPFSSTNNSVYNELNWMIDQYNQILVPNYNALTQTFDALEQKRDVNVTLQSIREIISDLETELHTTKSYESLEGTSELHSQLIVLFEKLVEVAETAIQTLEEDEDGLNEQLSSKLNEFDGEYNKFNLLLDQFYEIDHNK